MHQSVHELPRILWCTRQSGHVRTWGCWLDRMDSAISGRPLCLIRQLSSGEFGPSMQVYASCAASAKAYAELQGHESGIISPEMLNTTTAAIA